MGLSGGTDYVHDGISLKGLSLSGIRTAITLPEFSLAFDVAQGFPFLLNLKQFFISHGHLDHAAGIPYIISQKAMNRQETPNFYMPPSLVEPMDQIMKLWQKIENHQYTYNFHAVTADEEIPVKPGHFVRAFPTAHRIESFGYTLFHRQKKLAAEFQGMSQDEIVEIKKQGRELHDVQEIPLVSFTGDTQIEFLDSRPWVKKSKILLMESTYMDDKKSIQDARAWGHTHLDEIIPQLDSIESEKIVFIHLSSRYSIEEARKILASRIPARHQARVEIFPGR
ncbi:MAG: MBL fold metallo-hydrolase [Bdellovibrionaceae bacterium]|nr:MBL fold metallo-hydrolase [Pseudobdellovibrionaceae bacterium]